MESPLKRRIKSLRYTLFCFSASLFIPLVPLLTWLICLCGSQLSSVTNSLPSLSPSDSAQVSPQPLAPVSAPSQGCEEESPTHTPCSGAIRHRHHPLVYSLSSGKPDTVVTCRLYSFIKSIVQHIFYLFLLCFVLFQKMNMSSTRTPISDHLSPMQH